LAPLPPPGDKTDKRSASVRSRLAMLAPRRQINFSKIPGTTASFVAGVPVGDPNVPLDNTDSCRDVRRARDQRLSAGRVV